jgi:7-keto-8-aminopelargonate synthetase-like enzyme
MFVLDSGVGNFIVFRNKKFAYFAGNNYLGLAVHPFVKEASIRSIEQYGVNFSASRLTTGTATVHLELEKLLSAFKRRQDASVFASGYLGNRILLQVLRDEYDAVITDAWAHPSIIDGIPPGMNRLLYYDHGKTAHLEAILRKNKKYRPLIITDGLFALTGEIAPLDQIVHLAEMYNAIVIVDDAHATGILGDNGRGTPEYFHLEEADHLFQTETMSKALGAYGGFIAGSVELIRSIRKRSTVYQASTALPPPVVAAGCASLKILQEQPGMRLELLNIAKEVRSGVSGLGFRTTADNTPIIPVMFRSVDKAKDLSAFLEANQYIVPCIDYPAKTEMSIVRITVCISHTKEQTGGLIELLKKWRDKHGTDKD